MKKATKRRLIALLLPVPLLALGAAYLMYGRPGRSIEIALTFPEFCLWYLGVESPALAKAVSLGYWYLLLAMIAYAVLCGRDRVSKALFICVIATSAVIAVTLVLMRGYGHE